MPNLNRYYSYLAPVAADPLIRGYFSLVASLLLIAFFLIFALSPTFNTILSLQKKIDDQNKTIAALDTKINALIRAQDVYSQINNKIPLLNAALPDVPDPQLIAGNIMTTATSSGTAVISLQFQNIPLTADAEISKPVTANEMPVVVFNAGISGEQNQIHGFIQDLENHLRYIRLEKISVNYQSGVNSVTADVEGYGYYIKPK